MYLGILDVLILMCIQVLDLGLTIAYYFSIPNNHTPGEAKGAADQFIKHFPDWNSEEVITGMVHLGFKQIHKRVPRLELRGMILDT